jgi:hypothetical protein
VETIFEGLDSGLQLHIILLYHLQHFHEINIFVNFPLIASDLTYIPQILRHCIFLIIRITIISIK